MSRLLGSFWQLLNICHITLHTDRHKRKLTKVRMEKSDPAKCLIKNNNIRKLLEFKKINDKLNYKKDFDADTIKYAFLSKLNPGCLGPSSDIIILELGDNLNSDEEILRVAEMYKEDFSMEDHSFLNIIAD